MKSITNALPKISNGGFMFGLTKEAHGQFTPSSNSKSYSITHNLGSKPKFIVIYTDASLFRKTICNSFDSMR